MKPNQKLKRMISMLTSLAIIATTCTVVGLGTKASASVDEEWKMVQQIISQYGGKWTKPPTNVVTGNMTSGPILGNGDLGVVMGGDEDSQTYYISKSDFWALTKDDNSDGTPKAIGGLNIKNPSPSDGDISYSAVQDILNAEVISDLRFGGNPIHTKAWIAPNSNELIIEVTPVDKSSDITVQAELWSKSDNNSNGYTTSAGAGDEDIWVIRNTPERSKGTGRSAIAGRVLGAENIVTETDSDHMSTISFTIPAGNSAKIVTVTDGGKDNTECLANVQSRISELGDNIVIQLYNSLKDWWKEYWLKEYVVLNDRVLEEYYYGSLYQMGAASREGKVAPGLFGHWTTTDSPAWGGDYTLDYNYYGPFNGMASSNRLEQFGSYFQPILDFMEEGKKSAQAVKTVNGKSYPNGLPGVKYPAHIGPWGMETYFDCGMKSHAVFATIPFSWYYNYTLDKDFLRDTAYPYLIAVADFWDEYLQKDSTGRYVVYESSARESWSGSNDINPVLDIAFVRNLYTNLIPMSEKLGIDEDRHAKWQDILDNLSPLPTMEFNGRTVFKEADNRQEISTYGLGDNPVNMQGIFPGDNVGLGSTTALLETALNSLDTMNSWNQGNAFANIFVMCARVGWPAQDLMNKIKSRVSSIKQPNLTYQSDNHGLEGAGVLEAINSMLMQSHEHILRFFPVWPKTKDASFVRMRAVGAFLVDASLESGVVQPITVYSEKGEDCSIENPWEGLTLAVSADGHSVDTVYDGEAYTFHTQANTTYTIYPPEGLPSPLPTPDSTPLPTTETVPMPIPDIGWWKLDSADNGMAKDSTEHKNDAKIYGASDVNGKLSGAMHFDGTEDYVFIDNYQKPDAFATYSAWVKADRLTTWGTILKNWGEWNSGQIQLGLESDTGRLSVHVIQGSGNEVTCTEQSTFPLDTWQHIAVVADGSQIRLYRNGVETASTGYNGSLKTSFAPLGIGVKPNDSGNGPAGSGTSPGYWCGDIDDVRIYSTALTTEEIGVLSSFERHQTLFKEDFENPSILNTIFENRDGWSVGGTSEERYLQLGNNLGIASNALRFGAGDTWGQNMWLSLDVQENMMSKLLAQNADYDEAAVEVSKQLSNNVRVKFQIYFGCEDEDNRGASYLIKLKDSSYIPFAAIKITPKSSSRASESTLSLIALDKYMSQNKEYIILRGNENILKRTMSFTIDINKSDNTYKLNLNGQDVTTDHGLWTPASDNENLGDAKPHNIGDISVKQIDYVINNSGWWHTFTIDNIEVSKPDDVRVIDGEIHDVTDNDGTYNINSSFVNNSSDYVSYRALYALYDENNIVVGTAIEDIQIDPAGAKLKTVDIPYNKTPALVKLFVWNDIENMNPLSSYCSQRTLP